MYSIVVGLISSTVSVERSSQRVRRVITLAGPVIAAVTFTFVNQLQQCNSHLYGNVAIKELLLSFTQKAGQSYSWDSFCAALNCRSENKRKWMTTIVL